MRRRVQIRPSTPRDTRLKTPNAPHEAGGGPRRHPGDARTGNGLIPHAPCLSRGQSL